ncbi:glycosyl hydrolase family 65 protein [Nitrosomonas sp. Nm34]|uniref:glycosyl hydrolase family 65 protein n=1 Tax=Nitrosomonas sp. Nm34 TaxID=1881055 RepID=UPI001586FE69
MTIRGQILTVEIKESRVAYRLEQGEKLTIYHKDERSLIYNQGSQFTDLKLNLS